MGELDFLVGDELQQNSLAFFLGDLASPGEGGGNLVRVFDALGVAAHRLTKVGVVATLIAGAVELVGVSHLPGLNSHGRVVQNNGDDGYTAADGGLEV